MINPTDEELKAIEAEEAIVLPTPYFSDEEKELIRLCKLITGEQVIGVFLGGDSSSITLKRAMKLLQYSNSENETTFVLIKWPEFSPSEFSYIIKTGLISVSKINKFMYDFYLRSVNNELRKEGVVVPDEPEKPKEFIWPDWMNEPLEKKQIN